MRSILLASSLSLLVAGTALATGCATDDGGADAIHWSGGGKADDATTTIELSPAAPVLDSTLPCATGNQAGECWINLQMGYRQDSIDAFMVGAITGDEDVIRMRMVDVQVMIPNPEGAGLYIYTGAIEADLDADGNVLHNGLVIDDGVSAPEDAGVALSTFPDRGLAVFVGLNDAGTAYLQNLDGASLFIDATASNVAPSSDEQ